MFILQILTPLVTIFNPIAIIVAQLDLKGNQLPKTGDVMVGIWLYTIDGFNQREYLQIQLESDMVAGNAYVISFHVSLGDFMESSINSLGVHLSTTPVLSSDDGVLDVVPRIIESSFVDDTEEWVLISDTIVADTTYRYITIGNFNDDASTMTQANPLASGEPGTYGAYYFVDDVSVEETVLTSTDNLENVEFNIFPNPVDDKLRIEFSEAGKIEGIKIFSAQGIEVYIQNIDNQQFVNIDCSSFSSGTYFIQLQSESESIVRKLVKL